MRLAHMRDIGIVIGQADHEPQGLPEIAARAAHIAQIREHRIALFQRAATLALAAGTASNGVSDELGLVAARARTIAAMP